ncbi:MAG: undecaprenyl-diphosphate phosphatase, partial [Candidatus Microgenomates bacterium]
FSFLLSVPAVLGANLLEILSGYSGVSNWSPYLVGMIFSFLTGIIAIGLVIKFLKKGWFKYFAVYCFIIGILAILL